MNARLALAFLLATTGVGAACAGGITELDVDMPPAQEFGFGPRISAAGLYSVSVEPLQPIRVGQMHSWRLKIHDRDGAGIAGAAITVDGGMPQHGHGLPTRPRVTGDLGGGSYMVEGMRFNMGGWWVVSFHIRSAAGDDIVTFNLSL
jgi:hypothetical protein